MLELVRFTNLVGASIELNTDTIPLTHFEAELEVRSSHRNKAQAYGTWPGHTYTGAALVHMEGQIFGIDSATFNATKLGLLNTILPNPLVFVDDYPLGSLTLKLAGMSESASADCSIDGDISIPMEGLSPLRAPLQITFVVFQGYFIGDSSGTPYWIK